MFCDARKKLQNFGLVFIVGEEVQFLSGAGSSQKISTKARKSEKGQSPVRIQRVNY